MTNDKVALFRNIKLSAKDITLIKEITADGFDEDTFIESLLGFEDVFRGGGKSVENYIKAVQFSGYIGTGMTQTEAYEKCFPDRALVKKTQGDKVLTSAASIYANGQLVKNIMQRMYLHNSLLFMDKEFQARKRLFEIGMNGEGKTNVEALKVFLDNQYREKDKAGLEININTGQNGNPIDDLESALINLSKKQLEMKEQGLMDMKQIAESKIIDVEV